MDFVPLHCHSAFSFHAGVPSVRELVTRAKTLGLKALALTDTDRMSGLILFYLECARQGLQPILGVELTDPRCPDEHIVLLARNSEGYGDLCEIITMRHLQGCFSFEEVFSRPWPALFFLTSFPSLLECLARTPNRPALYGELINQSAETRQRSREVVQKAKALGLPLIVSNNTFFLDPEDHETHRVLTAIGRNASLSHLKPGETAPRTAFFRSPEEMAWLFPRHEEARRNTARIANACNVSLKLGGWILPEIEVPSGHTPETALNELAREGLVRNYAGKATCEQAKEIQEMELKVISRLGYASYFLIVKDIHDWANNRFRGGYRRYGDCTILRGSAANSITFYNLGVSSLDPIRHGLYFQRFLNEDRASPPDADLDFGWDERDEVFDYIFKKWGTDRVAVTCTTNHFRRRAAFREVAKVSGYTEAHISRILQSQETRTRRIEDSEIGRISDLAEKIREKPRFLGQHPGGLLITNDPIHRHVACEYSGGLKNRVITQIDMHNGIDELGLIKFDILGNGSLSVLRDTLKQLGEQGLSDPQVWDLEKCCLDPAVQDLVRTGRTKGIFYIESPAQARLNQRAHAGTFEEVTVTSSLVRPAGSRYTDLYVERQRKMKLGVKDWDFLHPALEPILRETHDVCAFQEDVIKICHHVAGLSYRQADKIRKMMNSMHEGEVPSEVWKETCRTFVDGCLRHGGLNRDQALELWERVSSFTGFSFCKSHSASYAQLSFKCAFLKKYYPAQFLSAVISNGHGFYAKDAYLNEARRWGIRILPIHINESRIDYFGKHQWIRPGLMHIRNLSRRSRENVLSERERNGPFQNLEDFIRRTQVHRQEVENLILVGAFDGFGLTQPESLYLLDGLFGKARTHRPSLFDRDLSLRHRELHPGLSDYTFAERCLNELRLLGFMLSGNILDILDIHPAARGSVSAIDICRHVGRRIKIFGWPVTARIHEVIVSGEPMMFLTLEDRTECVDVIFWPDVYERFADILSLCGPFEIWGRVTGDWGAFALEADAVRPVKWSPGQIDMERASRCLGRSFRDASGATPVFPTAVA